MSKKQKFYAYLFEDNNSTGICTNWDECKNIVTGRKSRYKSFKTEIEAKNWLNEGAKYELKAKKVYAPLKPGIYFDAGTGRGNGVEVKVTDINGNDLIHKVITEDKLTIHNTYLTEKGSTNNFGELLGCYIALKIAISENIKNIFGDSKLVVEYWSKGNANYPALAETTTKLITKVKKLRKQFEDLGGNISHVSGDINPADLGFHK